MPKIFLIFFLFVLLPLAGFAKVDTQQFGVQIVEKEQKKAVRKMFDSTINTAFQITGTKRISFLSKPLKHKNNALDFYLLLGLCGILGVIKTIHPKYFNDVIRAFINPTLGGRQLKEIIQANSFPNLLMNLFSSIVIGIYIYYLLSLSVDWRLVGIPNEMIVSLMILAAVLLYLFKYLAISFAGWAFNMSNSAEQYSFNVFLVNKILGMALLPFIVFFAFSHPSWWATLSIISLVILAVLFLNRYQRSWNIFASYFTNSRFHFFMYLCAFEIMPIAVLFKIVLRIL